MPMPSRPRRSARVRGPAARLLSGALAAALVLPAPPAGAANITGTAGPDVIVGGAGADMIMGGDGDDILHGDRGAGSGAPVSIVRLSTRAPDANGVEAELDGSSRSPVMSMAGDKAAFLGRPTLPGYVIEAGPNNPLLLVKSLGDGALLPASSTSPAADGSETVVAVGSGTPPASFSPEGGRIAFSSTSNTLPGNFFTSDIYVKDLGSRRLAPVVQLTGNMTVPVFYGDGARIAFVRTLSSSGPFDIYEANLSTGTSRVISGGPPNFNGFDEAGDGSAAAFDLTPDGRRVAIRSSSTNLLGAAWSGPKIDTNGQADVFVKNIETSGPDKGKVVLASSSSPDANGIETQADAPSQNPRISPDGRHVAFYSTATNLGFGTDGKGRLYVKDLVTRQLSAPAPGLEVFGFEVSPDWSEAVVTTVGAPVPGVAGPAAGSSIYRVDLVTGAIEPVATHVNQGQTTSHSALAGSRYTPDGSGILFTSGDSNVIAGDTNNQFDVFLATLPPSPGGNDSLDGGNGDDRLHGGPGDDMLAGGDGTDTAVYPGNRSRYAVAEDPAAPGTYTVSDLDPGASEGTDTLTGVEFLQFGAAAPVPVEAPGAANAPPTLTGPATVSALDGGPAVTLPLTVGDPDGDPITVEVVDAPTAGTLELVTVPWHSAIYEPDGSASTDSFKLRAKDPYGGESDFVVTVGIGLFIEGTDANNILSGGAQNDVIIGYGGNDTLEGNGGDDRLSGGAGDDIISGGDGMADTAVYPGPRRRYAISSVGSLQIDDRVTGSPEGKDFLDGVEFLEFADGTVSAADPGPGNMPPTLTGTTTITATAGGAPVTIPLTIADPEGDPATLEVQIEPTHGSLTLQSSPPAVIYAADAGAPTGPDSFKIAARDLYNAAGSLTVQVAVAGLDGTDGNDDISAGPTDDQIFGKGGNDILSGNGGKDTIDGGAGDDTVSGGAGDDTLKGGEGVDALSGGEGGDLLDGGAGVDTMAGGPGDDTFAVDDPGDTVSEAANEGVDTVLASVS